LDDCGWRSQNGHPEGIARGFLHWQPMLQQTALSLPSLFSGTFLSLVAVEHLRSFCLQPDLDQAADGLDQIIGRQPNR
jgi:hypothetical protein